MVAEPNRISELKPRSPIKQNSLRRHDIRLITRKTFNNVGAMTEHAGEEMNRLKTDVFFSQWKKQQR